MQLFRESAVISALFNGNDRFVSVFLHVFIHSSHTTVYSSRTLYSFYTKVSIGPSNEMHRCVNANAKHWCCCPCTLYLLPCAFRLSVCYRIVNENHNYLETRYHSFTWKCLCVSSLFINAPDQHSNLVHLLYCMYCIIDWLMDRFSLTTNLVFGPSFRLFCVRALFATQLCHWWTRAWVLL